MPISKLRLLQLQGLLNWYREELEQQDFNIQVDAEIRDILRIIEQDLKD